MLRPARGVVHMQHTLGQPTVPGLAHRAAFTGLVARDGVVVGHPVALGANGRLAVNAELASVGTVGGKNIVVGVQHDGRLGVVFEVGHQCLYGRMRSNSSRERHGDTWASTGKA
ncbi:hypothetical protein D3C75_1107090 [compost metagenome]